MNRYSWEVPREVAITEVYLDNQRNALQASTPRASVRLSIYDHIGTVCAVAGLVTLAIVYWRAL